eukprot:1314712-Amorphochlora_amoeboformis.AAC.1
MEIKIRSARSPRRPAEEVERDWRWRKKSDLYWRVLKNCWGIGWDSKAKLLLECEGQQLCSEGPIVWLKPKLRKDQ